MTESKTVEFEIKNKNDVKLLMTITKAIIQSKSKYCTHKAKCKILDDAMQLLEQIYQKNQMEVELTKGIIPFPVSTFQNKKVVLNETETNNHEVFITQIDKLLEQTEISGTCLIKSLFTQSHY